MRYVRWLLYGVFCGVLTPSALVAVSVLDADDPRLVWIASVAAALGIAGGLWAARRLTREGGGRALRVVDVVAFNLLGLLVLSEVAVLGMRALAPNRILWDESSVARKIAAWRTCEQSPYFEYPCNRRGYPDEEFFAPGPRDYVVALLADSFGAGSVPFDYNFATIAERTLRERLDGGFERVAIHNFGVNGIDVPEYRYLLDREVLAFEPRQVVLSLFVGNDIGSVVEAPQPARPALRHLLLQDWLVSEVLRRLRTISRALARNPFSGRAGAGERPAFLDDPELEPPFFDEREFAQIEADRLMYCVPGSSIIERHYHEMFRGLDHFRNVLGDRLLLVIIPDEFQVNDEVYAQALEHAAGGLLPAFAPRFYSDGVDAVLDREYPQRRILEWGERHGVRVLDLLPLLRRAEREGRTYHLRDTHWNARGNRVAGEAIAEALWRHELEETR